MLLQRVQLGLGFGSSTLQAENRLAIDTLQASPASRINGAGPASRVLADAHGGGLLAGAGILEETSRSGIGELVDRDAAAVVAVPGGIGYETDGEGTARKNLKGGGAFQVQCPFGNRPAAN